MGLESATYISDLIATNPVGASDPKSEGDDHLRMLKSVLKTTFPNINGAVNPTPAEFNSLAGRQAFIDTFLQAADVAAARTAISSQQDVVTTRGDAVRGSSSGAAERLALGTSGQALTSDGTDMVWGTPNLDWELIGTASPSGATTVDFTGLSSTYSVIKFVLRGIIPGTNNRALLLRVSTDNGSTFKTSDYNWSVFRSTASPTAENDPADSEIAISGDAQGLGTGADEELSVEITMFNHASSSNPTQFSWMGAFYNNAATLNTLLGAAFYAADTAVDAVRFLMASSATFSGEIRVYGLRDA